MKTIQLRFIFKWLIIGITLGMIVGSLIFFKGGTPEVVESTTSDTIHTSDTVVIRDTIRIEKPKPYIVEVVRVDTFFVDDTVRVAIPIERKTFKHIDYQAIIEGYKPELINIEIYKKDTFIHDTIRINNNKITYKNNQQRWVLTVGGGIGYTGSRKFEPYFGLTFGYVIWSK